MEVSERPGRHCSKEQGQTPSHKAHLEVIIMPPRISFILIFFNYWQDKTNVFKDLNKMVSLKEMFKSFLSWLFLFSSVEDDGDLLNCFYGKSLIM